MAVSQDAGSCNRPCMLRAGAPNTGYPFTILFILSLGQQACCSSPVGGMQLTPLAVQDEAFRTGAVIRPIPLE